MDRHEREIIGILHIIASFMLSTTTYSLTAHYSYKNNRSGLLETTARRTLKVSLQSLSRVDNAIYYHV